MVWVFSARSGSKHKPYIRVYTEIHMNDLTLNTCYTHIDIMYMYIYICIYTHTYLYMYIYIYK